jgi:DNA-binding response OmpR family regulator
MATLDKTILIIDDDSDFHVLVGSVLKKSGYKVLSLFDGTIKEVYKMVKSCDMVLLDIELPSVDGVEVGKQLKGDPNTQRIPIIMITGHTEGEKLFLESRANAFIQKPFLLTGLLSKIKECLVA